MRKRNWSATGSCPVPRAAPTRSDRPMKHRAFLLLMVGLLGCGQQRVAVPEEIVVEAPTETPEKAPVPPEPSLNGKTATQWARALGDPAEAAHTQATEALKEMGTDAIPALRRALIGQEPS